MPAGSIIVARNLSAADLVDYDHGRSGASCSRKAPRRRMSPSSPGPSTCRCSGGRPRHGADRERRQAGLDAEHGQVSGPSLGRRAGCLLCRDARPAGAPAGLRTAHKDQPAVTRDGMKLELSIMRVFSSISTSGLTVPPGRAYTAPSSPSCPARFPRSGHPGRVLRGGVARAGSKPVCFRTLDIGSDKQLSLLAHARTRRTCHGAGGAFRLTLDRPGHPPPPLRALLRAAAGRPLLRVMFPMVAEVAEFRAARHILGSRAQPCEKAGQPCRADRGGGDDGGALALLAAATLLKEVDFLSVGSNDLLQFLSPAIAARRRLGDRYDVLSPTAMKLHRRLVEHCGRAGGGAAVCGEMASRRSRPWRSPGSACGGSPSRRRRSGGSRRCCAPLMPAPLATYLKRLLDLPDHSLMASPARLCARPRCRLA